MNYDIDVMNNEINVGNVAKSKYLHLMLTKLCVVMTYNSY